MKRKASRTSIAKAEVIRVHRWAIAGRIAAEIVEVAAGVPVAVEGVAAVAVDVRVEAAEADGIAAVVAVDATRALSRICTDSHG